MESLLVSTGDAPVVIFLAPKSRVAAQTQVTLGVSVSKLGEDLGGPPASVPSLVPGLLQLTQPHVSVLPRVFVVVSLGVVKPQGCPCDGR